MAGAISTVMPGERFTAVLMNQLVEALVTLDQRIAALEGRGSVITPPTAPVTIAQLVPSGEVKVGDELRVFGSNFGYSSGAIHVAVGNTPITQFKIGTSDSALVFNVPGLVDALPASLQVAVSNGATSAGRSISVKPATELGGSVSVEFTPIDPPDEGKTAKWRVRLISQATQLATFGITSSVSQTVWQSELEVVADASSTTPITSVALTPNQPTDVYVKLPIPGAPGTTFTLTFAVNSGSAGGTATSPTYTVGTDTPPVDTSSGATFGSVTGSNLHFDPATKDVTLRPGQNVTVTMNVSLSIAGTYKVTQTPTPDEQEYWVLAPLQASDTFTVGASEVSGGQSAARQLKYKITAYGEALEGPVGKPGRIIGGGPGTLEVTIRRQTQAGPSQPATMLIPFDNP